MNKRNRYDLKPYLRYRPVWVIRLVLIVLLIPTFVMAMIDAPIRFLWEWGKEIKDVGNYESVASVMEREQEARELVGKYFQGGLNEG